MRFGALLLTVLALASCDTTHLIADLPRFEQGSTYVKVRDFSWGPGPGGGLMAQFKSEGLLITCGAPGCFVQRAP